LKAGITTEAEDHFLSNNATTDNRPNHELYGVVAAILSFQIYKREFIREYKRFIRKRIHKVV
jgi:hypothetical protein